MQHVVTHCSTSFPLQQGLRLDVCNITLYIFTSFTSFPLQQGLKHIKHVVRVTHVVGSTLFPLQQGLKHHALTFHLPLASKFYIISITTRIKTCLGLPYPLPQAQFYLISIITRIKTHHHALM